MHYFSFVSFEESFAVKLGLYRSIKVLFFSTEIKLLKKSVKNIVLNLCQVMGDLIQA